MTEWQSEFQIECPEKMPDRSDRMPGRMLETKSKHVRFVCIVHFFHFFFGLLVFPSSALESVEVMTWMEALFSVAATRAMNIPGARALESMLG